VSHCVSECVPTDWSHVSAYTDLETFDALTFQYCRSAGRRTWGVHSDAPSGVTLISHCVGPLPPGTPGPRFSDHEVRCTEIILLRPQRFILLQMNQITPKITAVLLDKAALIPRVTNAHGVVKYCHAKSPFCWAGSVVQALYVQTVHTAELNTIVCITVGQELYLSLETACCPGLAGVLARAAIARLTPLSEADAAQTNPVCQRPPDESPRSARPLRTGKRRWRSGSSSSVGLRVMARSLQHRPRATQVRASGLY